MPRHALLLLTLLALTAAPVAAQVNVPRIKKLLREKEIDTALDRKPPPAEARRPPPRPVPPRVDRSRVYIAPAGLNDEALAEILADKTALYKLDLSQSAVTDDGLRHLSTLTPLRELILPRSARI